MARHRLSLLLAILLLVCGAGSLAAKQGGVMVAGDIWDAFMPSNAGTFYSEGNNDPAKRWTTFRIGNWDRQWSQPTQMYPGGENLHLPWGQDIQIAEYSSEDINTITTSSAPRAKRYAFGIYTSKLQGANDPARDWTTDSQGAKDAAAAPASGASSGGAYWTSADRTEMRYEGSMPTTLGVDVGWRVRQYATNAGHLNDFIVVEMELTNTGVLDVNGDGTAEKTNHRIEAMTLMMQHEVINSMTNGVNGARGTSGWYTGPTSGYDATPDANGEPWDVPVIFSGPSLSSLNQPHPVFGTPTGWATDGNRMLGVTMRPLAYYYDVYSGFQWIAAKQGGLPTTGSSAGQADKKTIYDSPPIGSGMQKGWFTSQVKDDGGDSDPRASHIFAMSAFLDGDKIGSRAWDKGASIQKESNILPDPNWFDPTSPDIVPGDPLSFVKAVRPEGQRGQPRGDMKYNQKFVQNWEVDATKSLADQPAWAWTKGFSIDYNFDGKHQAGIGPFSLEVGETMNVVLIEYGGFRLQGVRAARRTAQAVYDGGFTVPTPPAAPDMKLVPNTNVKVDVEWDNRAESAPDFAGYKVYRSTLFPKVDSRAIGVRLVDRYQEQTKENPTDAELAAFGEANNPNISSSAYRTQEPSAWGPYHLVKIIPKAQLANYLNAGLDKAQYKYKWADESDLISFGFTYYYYVAAYDNESGSIAGTPFTSLESHRQNVNGRDGLWKGTYHYATASSFFPSTPDGQKAIGAPFVLKAPLPAADSLIAGALKVRVVPNPYKKGALHDTGTQHKMLFINLPTGTKITIFDVSGQVVDVLRFEGTNPLDGTLFWDMFSKDGIEVASGLYVYVAEYPGGTQTGQFAILR